MVIPKQTFLQRYLLTYLAAVITTTPGGPGESFYALHIRQETEAYRQQYHRYIRTDIGKYPKPKLIKLQESFTINNERHVQEALVYGQIMYTVC